MLLTERATALSIRLIMEVIVVVVVDDVVVCSISSGLTRLEGYICRRRYVGMRRSQDKQETLYKGGGI